jgi:NitT/TauT family transport system permease protein
MSPLAVRGISVLVGLVLWEVFGRQVNPIFMSYPSAIAVAAADLVRSGELLAAFLSSIQSLLLGYGIAAALGIPLGLFLGRYRLVEYALDIYVSALYATPLVALIPLVILWFGLGVKAKIFIVFILSVFPILINTYVGVRNVSRSLIEVGVAFCAKEAEIFTKIVLPATVPFIMAGLRLGIGRAIIGMVVAEFFTSVQGLGAVIINSANFFQTARMFVPILVLMGLGVGTTALLERLEHRIAPWKQTERA